MCDNKANLTLSMLELSPIIRDNHQPLVKERNAQPLDTWLRDCQMSGINNLVTFAQGLEKEGRALHAALTLPYSN
jgi:transposase